MSIRVQWVCLIEAANALVSLGLCRHIRSLLAEKISVRSVVASRVNYAGEFLFGARKPHILDICWFRFLSEAHMKLLSLHFIYFLFFMLLSF